MLDSVPCLACVSEHEMLAIMVGILALAMNKTVAEAMADGACFACMSRKQMMQALVVLMGNNLLGERNTAEEVIEMTHCLNCAPDHQLLAAILQMLCSITIAPTQN